MRLSLSRRRHFISFQLINTAKCNAILDAQVEEKKKIAQLIFAEERVLDHCSEAARQKAIKEMEEVQAAEKRRRMEVAAHIRKQISERELLKILELDQKEQENELLRKEYDRMMQEDMAELQKKAAKKKEFLVRKIYLFCVYMKLNEKSKLCLVYFFKYSPAIDRKPVVAESPTNGLNHSP